MGYRLRDAVAMIELIFALLIMAIVLMSVPRLISTATKSSFVALQQESINEAASHINMIMGYHWDENTTDERYLDPILTVSATGDTNLSYKVLNSWRIGTPKESSRSFIRQDGTSNIVATAPSKLGMEAGEPHEDDVDDFIGDYTLINEGVTTSDVADKNINVATSVSYALDSPSGTTGPYDTTGGDRQISFNDLTDTNAGSTNIKHISVTLTSTSNVSEFEKSIVLHAFVCNIGAYELEKKAF